MAAPPAAAGGACSAPSSPFVQNGAQVCTHGEPMAEARVEAALASASLEASLCALVTEAVAEATALPVARALLAAVAAAARNDQRVCLADALAVCTYATEAVR